MANERVIITDPADFEKPGIKEAITRWLTAEKQYESEGILTVQTEEDWAKWLHTHPDVPYDLWYDKEINDQYNHYKNQGELPAPETDKAKQKKAKKKKQDAPVYSQQPNSPTRAAIIDTKRVETATKWQTLTQQYPELLRITNREEFLAWQKTHTDVSTTAWSYKKYHDILEWRKAQASLPQFATITTEEQFKKARIENPEIPEHGWLYKAAADTDVIGNKTDVKDKLSRLDAVQASVKNNSPLPSQQVQQAITPEMQKFKDRHERKQQRKQKNTNPNLNQTPPPVPTLPAEFSIKTSGLTTPPDLRKFRKQIPVIKYTETRTEGTEEIAMGEETEVRGGDYNEDSSAEQTMDQQEDDSSNDDQGSSPQQQSSSQSLRKSQDTLKGANSLLSKLGKNPKGLLRGLGGAGAGGEATTAAALTSEVWVPILVGILLIIFMILIVILMLGGGEAVDEELEPGQIPVTISKTGPSDVANSEAIAYTIQASYAGVADDVVITDIIPDNADLVENETTQPYTYDPSTRTITWSLREMQQNTRPTGGVTPSASQAAVSTFPQELYESYGFPPPESPNPVTLSGENLQNWQQNMEQYAEEVADKIGVDIGLIGMWPLLEQINYTTLYDNCNDPGERSGLGVDTNPNTPCPYINWQVGFGVRPMDIYPYLAEAMTEMHPGQTAQEVGQSVMAKYQEAGQPITYPSQAFPQTTIEDLLDQIQPGVGLDGLGGNQRMPDESALAARTYVALLMKDEAVSTYILGKIFDQLSGTQMASAMESWNSTYYNRQKVINHIAAVHTSGVTEGIRFSPQTVTLTLLPTEQDTYITNQATAHVIGAQIGSGSGGTPNDDNCGGYYDLTRNALGQNFGDPQCTMLANDNPTHMSNLYTLLEELDPNNALYWFTTIIPCESNFIPNAYLGPAVGGAYGSPDAAGAWGMFQMGRGLNGEYDHGDVVWELQVSNAINYNNMLREINLEWQYWECARG